MPGLAAITQMVLSQFVDFLLEYISPFNFDVLSPADAVNIFT
jgi:hypothetical protein